MEAVIGGGFIMEKVQYGGRYLKQLIKEAIWSCLVH
jgi:hypothetical protein